MPIRRLSYLALPVFAFAAISCSRFTPMARSTFTPSNGMVRVDPVEGKLDFHLPAVGEAKATQPDASDAELPRVTVSVRLDPERAKVGAIKSIVVQTPRAEKSVSNIEALEPYLKSIRAELANETDVMIIADAKIRYADVIQVMDACIRAGFNRVSFAPPPDLEK